jgi:hypothetical protein
MGGRIQKGRNRERTPWQPPLDSAPPVITDDSEQALDHVPQPLQIRKPQRFRRTLKPGPFLRSAPNRTGTTHPVTHGRRTSTKNNKSVMENGKARHANFLGEAEQEKKQGLDGGIGLRLWRENFHASKNLSHPRRLGLRADWYPALTHWANVFRASGAKDNGACGGGRPLHDFD